MYLCVVCLELKWHVSCCLQEQAYFKSYVQLCRARDGLMKDKVQEAWASCCELNSIHLAEIVSIQGEVQEKRRALKRIVRQRLEEARGESLLGKNVEEFQSIRLKLLEMADANDMEFESYSMLEGVDFEYERARPRSVTAIRDITWARSFNEIPSQSDRGNVSSAF